jgi:hypothetical protein
MNRRSILAGLAAVLAPLRAWAQPKWAIFQDQVTGGLPAGVTLVDIDGGTNFYTNNGFTYSAAAGMDTTMFPILDWLQGMNPGINPTGPARMLACGCNVIAALDSNANSNINALNMVKAQPGLYLAQGITSGLGNATNAWIANALGETVWFLLNDEPQGWYNPTDIAGNYKDIKSAMNGTNNISATLASGFQTGRACWTNMFHSFFDGPTNLNPASYGYPALPGGVNYPGGLMTPAEIIATPVPNNDLINRKTDITGSDYYWITTDLLQTDGTNVAPAVCYGIYDFGTGPANPGGPITPGTGSFTFPVNNTNYNQALIGVGNAVQLSNGVDVCNGFATAWTPGSPGSITVNFTAHIGPGTAASNFTLYIFASMDQLVRGSHYGDQIDMFRPYCINPTPLIGVVETGSPGTTARTITPPQLNVAVWSSIIHGARGILYFSVSFNTPGGNTSVNLGNVYYQSIQTGNTISIFDRVKATDYLIQALTPVLLSKFAEGSTTHLSNVSPGYVKVTGDNVGGATVGFQAPFRVASPAVVNQRGAYPYTGGPGVTGTFPFSLNNPAYNFNASLASAFEVMAKRYEGSTQTVNGVLMRQFGFWIFCGYRGSANDGASAPNANTLTANFTIAAAAASVTRFYSDAVLGAAAAAGFAGTRTTITCGSTLQMAINDTVIIAGTSGVPGLNGTFTIQSSNFTSGATNTFDILLAFSGTFTFLIGSDVGGAATCGAGTIIAMHDILTVAGTTFTDTFPTGNSIGIYRVNP